jgi:6-phosphogluconolactonase (cycloisomerase 2 family)
MDKTVPRATGEFLFLGDAGAPLITGFRINGDGSLAPVPGSPFAISAPARALAVIQDTLVIADKRGIISYQVNRDTGTLQQTDAGMSSLADVDRTSSANMRPQLAVLDATGRFMYVADVNRGELAIYQTNNGRPLALSKSTIPISNATISIAIVKP